MLGTHRTNNKLNPHPVFDLVSVQLVRILQIGILTKSWPRLCCQSQRIRIPAFPISVIMRILHCSNPNRFNKSCEADAQPCITNLINWSEAVAEILTWPEYTPQPLRTLPNTAKDLGLTNIFFKDESKRFGTQLGSFKALGAPYAVFKLLSDAIHAQTGTYPSGEDLRSGKYRSITERVTVCVATDGNQGRGLAYGARTFGCRCVIYIHSHVSAGREEKMMHFGATVIRIDGEYEASVNRAREDARMNGWHFVSSTSWNDFDDRLPRHVMNAYMVVVEETLAQLYAIEDITHVFVCGGVGSIAAAMFLGFWHNSRSKHQNSATLTLPRFVVVEPETADCLYQSAIAGRCTQSNGSLRTLMAGLACRAPSPAAWKLLCWLASDFVAVPDKFATIGMASLANSRTDIPVVCGESSAASMGVLLHARADPVFAQRLGLNESSQVVMFGLEGATDPEIYQRLVGRRPDDVFSAQATFECSN